MDLPSFMQNGIKFFQGSKKPRRTSMDFLNALPNFEAPSLQTDRSIKQYIQSDPDLAANLRKLVDNILLHNPILIQEEGKKVSDKKITEYQDLLDTNRFAKKLRSIVYSLIWSGNAFLEVQFTTNKSLKEIYFIDPEYMKFKRNVSGEVIGYVQEVPGHKPVNFNKDNIIHFTIDHLDSSASGLSFIGALKDALFRKEVAESYLAWIISHNKLNRFWLVKGDINEDDMRATIQQLRYSSQNPNLTTVVGIDEGIEITFNRYFDTEDFDAITKYISEQKSAIASILQVPPIIAGNVDASNRSNSEIQARFVFYNTILNFQKQMLDELNWELLKRINWKNVKFIIPHTDRSVTLDIFKIASVMQGIGFTQDAILEYLKGEGFAPPKVDEMFEPKVEESMDGNNFGGRNPLKPTASREARDKTGIPKNEKKRNDEKKTGVTKDVN